MNIRTSSTNLSLAHTLALLRYELTHQSEIPPHERWGSMMSPSSLPNRMQEIFPVSRTLNTGPSFYFMNLGTFHYWRKSKKLKTQQSCKPAMESPSQATSASAEQGREAASKSPFQNIQQIERRCWLEPLYFQLIVNGTVACPVC